MMLDILWRKWIPADADVNDEKVRFAYGRWCSFFGIFCNLILFGAKITVGLLFGSVAILADAFNNLTDAASSVVSLLGFSLANRPADADHPYGHGRYEYLAGLLICVFVFLIGFELLKESFAQIIAPTVTVFSYISIAVLAGSILVKLLMSAVNRKIGKKIASQSLIATAQDSRNDVISTSAVLVTTILSRFIDFSLDGYVGLLVALFILWSGFSLLKETIYPILGSAPSPELVAHIKEKILSYEGVLGTHDLLVHDYGPGKQFASVHVEMAAEADPIESHDLIDNIEQFFLQKEGLHLVIHFDPIVTTDETVGSLREWISQIAVGIHPTLSIHDLRVVFGVTHTNLIFDCVLPYGIDLEADELKARLREEIAKKDPSYRCVITVDRDYAALPHEKEAQNA
jgi:cation diffusion facilitator family transporter